MFDVYHIHPSQREESELSNSEKLEYVKLWMQQSQLFWSRLQTATALHTGILVGWYYRPAVHRMKTWRRSSHTLL